LYANKKSKEEKERIDNDVDAQPVKMTARRLKLAFRRANNGWSEKLAA